MPSHEIIDEELNDVLGSPPSILMRYGNLFMLLLIFILLFLSVIIRYPDYISGQAIVRARNAAFIQSPQAGLLGALFVANGERVDRGKPLCKLICQGKEDTLRATASGVVEFQRELKVHDEIDSLSPLFFIRNPKEHYKVEIRTSIARSGKIKPGQVVYISFNQFPQQEYGEVRARILSRPFIQTNNEVVLEAELEKGLHTTNGSQLEINMEASGQASVILGQKPFITKLWPL